MADDMYVDKDAVEFTEVVVRRVPPWLKQRCKAKAALEGLSLGQVIINYMIEYQKDLESLMKSLSKRS